MEEATALAAMGMYPEAQINLVTRDFVFASLMGVCRREAEMVLTLPDIRFAEALDRGDEMGVNPDIARWFPPLPRLGGCIGC